MASLSLRTKLALATTVLFLATSLMLQNQPIADLRQETRLARRFGFGYGSPPSPASTTPPSRSSSGMLTDASTVDNSGKITSGPLPDADADAAAISEEVTFTALADAAIVDHSRITSTPCVPVASAPAPKPSPRQKSEMTKIMSVLFFLVFVFLCCYLLCVFVMGVIDPDILTGWENGLTARRNSYLTSQNRFCKIARHNLGAIYNVGLGLFLMMLAVHFLWPLIAFLGHAHTWAPDLEDMELLVGGMGAIVR